MEEQSEPQRARTQAKGFCGQRRAHSQRGSKIQGPHNPLLHGRTSLGWSRTSLPPQRQTLGLAIIGKQEQRESNGGSEIPKCGRNHKPGPGLQQRLSPENKVAGAQSDRSSISRGAAGRVGQPPPPSLHLEDQGELPEGGTLEKSLRQKVTLPNGYSEMGLLVAPAW